MTKIAPDISPEILGLPPRGVTLAGWGWYSVIVLVIMLVCTAVLPGVLLQQRSDRLHALMTNGIPVPGMVTRYHPSSDNTSAYDSDYGFTYLGHSYTGESKPLQSEYPPHLVGSAVTIYVLPGDPKHSHLGPVTPGYIQRTSQYLRNNWIQMFLLVLVLIGINGNNMYRQWKMMKYGVASEATVEEIRPGKSANTVVVVCRQDLDEQKEPFELTGYRRLFSDLSSGSKLTYFYRLEKPEVRIPLRFLLAVRFVERSPWRRS